MSTNPFDPNDDADELPPPDVPSTITGLRFFRCSVSVDGTEQTGIWIGVYVLIGGKAHWGVLSPPHAAQAVSDIIKLSVQIGGLYAFTVIGGALHTFAESDISEEMYKLVEGFHVSEQQRQSED